MPVRSACSFLVRPGALTRMLGAGCTLALMSMQSKLPLSAPVPPERRPEDVLALWDDMQNGRFDAFTESGSGTYAVVDDGGGNQVARLTDEMTLGMHEFALSGQTWHDYDLTLRVKWSATGTTAYGFRWIPTSPPSLYRLEHSSGTWSLERDDAGTVTQLGAANFPLASDQWHDLLIRVEGGSTGTWITIALNAVVVMELFDAAAIPFGGLRFETIGGGTTLHLDDCEVVEHVDSRYTWTQTGGPEGGWVTGVAVHPHDWHVAYVSGYDGGVYRTTDGGASWEEIGLPNELPKVRIRTMELAPSDPSVIYVGTESKHVSSLWRTDDGGAMWKWTQAGDVDLDADTPAIAVDPNDAMHVYVALNRPDLATGEIYESRDGGATLTALSSGGNLVQDIAIESKSNPDHILAAPQDASVAGASILRSDDGGATWTPSDTGLGGADITQVFFYEPDPTHVFAQGGGTLYRSTDGGTSWAVVSGVTTPTLIALSPQPSGPTLLVFSALGLWTSTDKGSTWTLSSSNPCIQEVFVAGVGTDDPDVLYTWAFKEDLMLSTDLGRSCTPVVSGLRVHSVQGLTTDPSDPATVYTATIDALYKSTDRGDTWTPLRSGTYSGMAVDPVDRDTVYIGDAYQALILKSIDGGSTWTDITGAITFPGVATIAIDPNDPQQVWAGTGHGPQGGTAGEGLYRSPDGGLTWIKVPGIPDVEVPAIAIGPGSARVAVSTMGNGVYVSHDGGATFVQRNNGFTSDPTGSMVFSLAMDPSDPDVMYAGTHAWYGRTSIPHCGLYKTTDGGLNWNQLLGNGALPQVPKYSFLGVGAGVDHIAIDPSDPDNVYVALHDPGVISSPNGGVDWRYNNHGIVPLLTHSYPYRMSVTSGGEILYAASCGRSVFRNRLNAIE